MRKFFVVVVTSLFMLNCVTSQEEEKTQLDGFLQPYRVLRLLIFDKQLRNSRQYTYNKLYQNDKLQKIIPKTSPFPCDVKKGRSASKPKSVHQLRPGDIDVIGAIGDSLTVGSGLSATNILEIAIEERGKSFTIGGEGTWREFLTVANILKEFNGNLIGYALGPSLSIQRNSQFNVAEVGAVSKNIPYMTKVLIKRIKADRRINTEEDWKMISIFVGHNDFCSEICYMEKPEIALEKHRRDMTTVLRLLRDNLPRTMVNLIPPPNLKVLVDLVPKPLPCNVYQRVACPCLFGLPFQHQREYFFHLMEQWRAIDATFGSNPEFDSDNFTVVIQPFMTDYAFPKTPAGHWDFTFLSEDCFHFSQKAHARVANDLWNNLLEPVGRKSTRGRDLLQEFHCPSNLHPYIFTRRNS